MADDDFAELATGLNEDAKAARKAKAKEPNPGADADFNQHMTPTDPKFGDSWWNPTDETMRYWHGVNWYLSPPQGDEPTGDEPTAEPAAGTGAAAIAAMNAAADAEEADDPGEPVATGESAATEAADDDDDANPIIDRMVGIADDFQVDARSLVQDGRDFMLEMIKHRPKLWSNCSEKEQSDLAAGCEQAMAEIVRKMIEAVAVGHKQPIRAILESYTEKDGIKLSMKVKTYNEEEACAAVVALHRARGKAVLLTVADLSDYSGGSDAATDPDEPPLNFEGGDLDEDEGGEENGD